MVIPHIFNDGNLISSTEVNQNFTVIKDKINESEFGVTIGMSGDLYVSDGNELILPFDMILEDNTGGAFDASNYTFTVPPGEGGFYNIYATYLGDTYCTMQCEFKIFDGASEIGMIGTYISDTQSTQVKTIHLPDGAVISFKAFNGMSMGAVSYSVVGASTKILIKREARF